MPTLKSLVFLIHRVIQSADKHFLPTDRMILPTDKAA
jgi:hypothetical protein